jgi:hypothetical protein
MQLKMLTAVQLMEKTMSCVLHKMWVWFIVCFCYFASILVGTGIGLMFYAVDVQSSLLTQIGTVIGLGVCGYFAHKLRGSTLVPERTGHVRVLVEQLDQAAVFEGKTQLEKAQKTTADYFGDIFKLAELERSIRCTLQDIFTDRLQTQRYAFNNARVKTVLDTLVGILVAFVAEVILAFYIKNRGSESPGTTCKLALTLFAQKLDELIKPIWMLNLFMFTGFFICYALLLYPINWATDLLPVSVGIWKYVLALIFAWGIKAVFMESIAVAALIPVFFDTVKDQKPDAKVAKRLTELSKAYQQLG